MVADFRRIKNKRKKAVLIILLLLISTILFQNCAPQGGGGDGVDSGLVPPTTGASNCVFDTSKWDDCLWL